MIDFNITQLDTWGRIPLTNDQKGAKVKLMVWNNLSSIKPMVSLAEYNIN